MPDAYVGSALIDMYVKCGYVLDARRVFEGMYKRNNVLWTTMIAGMHRMGMVWRLYHSFGKCKEQA